MTDQSIKVLCVEDDELDNPIEHQEKVAKFSLGDFTEMFSYHQLQVQEVFGDYNFNSYHVRNSPRMLMIAKKLDR